MHPALTSYEGNSLPHRCKHTLHRTPDKEYSITVIIQLPFLDKVCHLPKKLLCFVSGQVKHLAIYQLEVDKHKEPFWRVL